MKQKIKHWTRVSCKSSKNYGQFILDNDLENITLTEQASILLGHLSVKMTESFYASVRQDKVVEIVSKDWKNGRV